MQKLFDVEMEKVTSLTLTSANILERELDENDPDWKETKSSQVQNHVYNPNTLDHNGPKDHKYILDYKEKENLAPPANFSITKNTHGDHDNPHNNMLRCSATPLLSYGIDNVKNMHPTTQNLNKVY